MKSLLLLQLESVHTQTTGLLQTVSQDMWFLFSMFLAVFYKLIGFNALKLELFTCGVFAR